MEISAIDVLRTGKELTGMVRGMCVYRALHAAV